MQNEINKLNILIKLFLLYFKYMTIEGTMIKKTATDLCKYTAARSKPKIKYL